MREVKIMLILKHNLFNSSSHDKTTIKQILSSIPYICSIRLEYLCIVMSGLNLTEWGEILVP